MSKGRFFLLSSLAVILVGAAIISFTIEVVWMLVSGQDYLPMRRLIFNFIIGLFVGTALILLQLLLMRFQKRPLVGYLLSAVTIAGILLLVYLHTGLTLGVWGLDTKWLVIFLVVESLSMLLVAYWNRQTGLYNRKLESKKALLRARRNP